MPGKIYAGDGDANPEQKQAWSYCEGVQARIDGEAQIDNPHSITGDPAAYLNWDGGWLHADGFAGTAMGADDTHNCSGAGQTVPVLP